MPPVTIYTRRQCRACDRVKAKLEENGIDYDTVDIDLNYDAYTYVTQVLGAKAVPVIVTDTHKPIIGYHPDKVEELIKRLSSPYEGIHDYVYEGENDE